VGYLPTLADDGGGYSAQDLDNCAGYGVGHKSPVRLEYLCVFLLLHVPELGTGWASTGGPDSLGRSLHAHDTMWPSQSHAAMAMALDSAAVAPPHSPSNGSSGGNGGISSNGGSSPPGRTPTNNSSSNGGLSSPVGALRAPGSPKSPGGRKGPAGAPTGQPPGSPTSKSKMGGSGSPRSPIRSHLGMAARCVCVCVCVCGVYACLSVSLSLFLCLCVSHSH
jgi:hypothetical protein